MSTVLLIAAIMLGVSMGARAEVATEADARLVARNWVAYVAAEKGMWGGAARPSLGAVREIVVGDTLVGWCLSVQPSGHVVVPVLRELPPVKAYSEEHGLDPYASDGYPRLIREVLQDRVRRFVRRHGSVELRAPLTRGTARGRAARDAWERLLASPEAFDRTLAAGRQQPMTEVGPLLTTSWDQGFPYNKFCPMGDGGRCVVGCVATAAAQILRYHSWPPAGSGSYCYNWPGDYSCGGSVGGGELCADYSDPYDWENMPNSCGIECSTTEQDALAELNYEVGVAYDMQYGHCGSGAYMSGTGAILSTHFRYLPTVQERSRSAYTAGGWFSMIKTEINAGRPILYGISGATSGHAIVCDGWRDTGGINQYHMNYGWGGPYTGWYVLDDLYGSEYNEQMYRRIQPDLPPSSPTGLAAAPDDAASILSWDENPETDINHYRIERDTLASFGAGTTTFTSQAAACIDHPLVNGRQYYYRVFAVDDGGGESTPSDTVSCVPAPMPPSSPVGLAAAVGDAAVELSWQANPEPDIDHYAVYRDTVPGASRGSEYGVSDTPSFIDSLVVNYTSYYYRVAAVDTGGLESGLSGEVRAVPHGIPPRPVGLTATPGDSSAMLMWRGATFPALEYYCVYRDTTPAMLTPLFSDGFESYAVGAKPSSPPWIVVEQSGTSARVCDSLHVGGAKSLALSDSTFGYTRLFHTLDDTLCSSAWIEWWVRPGETGSETNLFACEAFGDEGMGKPAGVLEVCDGWLRHWVQGSAPVAVGECTSGAWHHVVWKLDCEFDTYDVLLDDEPVVTGASFYNSARYVDIVQLRSETSEWARAWIDDIYWASDVPRMATAVDTVYVDEPLENGRTYYYRVAAVDTFGTKSAPSDVVDVVPGGTSVSEGEGAGGLRASLSYGRPNPFAVGTTLAYTVPAAGADVTLRVYDVGGRLVRTLVDDYQDGGAYRLLWTGVDEAGHKVASGVYFCRVSIGKWRRSRKLVVLR
jgi:fibronectin type 3 domain-containing protein